MRKPAKKRSRYLTKKTLLTGLVLLVIVGLTVHWLPNRSSTISNHNPVQGTTSVTTPHQTAPSVNNGTTGQGGVIDQNGQTSGSLPPSSDWTSSSSGNITLQQPTARQTIESGDTLGGLATVDTVQFILKDDSVGVIAQGSLSVVDGKFSGTLKFTPHAHTGQLEVFHPDPTTGAEKDIINIDVKYNI